MAILLTGGTGKTSLLVAQQLQKDNVPFLLASRRGPSTAPAGMQAVKFDWNDTTTYETPFLHQFPNNEKITGVYIVAPDIEDTIALVNTFLDVAHKNGVERFVLMTGSGVTKGGDFTGKVWSHLDDLKVEYSVLLCTWFMENFAELQHLKTIKDEDKIYTLAADGRAPFVSAKDIAAVAYEALRSPTPPQESYLVLGPQLLTHDEIVTKISKATGRTIEHDQSLTGEELAKKRITEGMSPDVAALWNWLESETAAGGEERFSVEDFGDVKKAIGQDPITFDQWLDENKTAWD